MKRNIKEKIESKWIEIEERQVIVEGAQGNTKEKQIGIMKVKEKEEEKNEEEHKGKKQKGSE